jgi:hypothetical protein
MSRAELVEAYVRGEISRRVFIRRLVAGGISLAAAVTYAEMGPGLGGLRAATAAGFYESSCKLGYKGQITSQYGDTATFNGKASMPPAQGQEFYTDVGPNFPLTFSSTTVTGVGCTNPLPGGGKEAFIQGTGVVGTTTYDFTIRLGDGSGTGGADTYRLELITTTGTPTVYYDSLQQTLTSGSVRIH